MADTYPLEKFFIYFSPHTAHAITIDGVTYPTVEHAYQCQRYADPRIISEILSADSPVKAWEISSKHKPKQVTGFGERKLGVMKRLMQAKVEQHDDVRQALFDSGDMAIIKHITTYPPGDGFWDDGPDGKGLNHMGKMWMAIREEMRNTH